MDFAARARAGTANDEVGVSSRLFVVGADSMPFLFQTSLDKTTLTRNLRPLLDAGWVAIETGEDRRKKLVRLTDAEKAKLTQARPAWQRAQDRLRSRLPKADWSSLLALLPEVARLAGEA
jgi:DNA-binding PadR family transcriptional regulator